MAVIINVLLFPPNEVYNILVKLLSLYGIKSAPSASFYITTPRVDKLKFILQASFKVCPVAPVLL